MLTWYQSINQNPNPNFLFSSFSHFLSSSPTPPFPTFPSPPFSSETLHHIIFISRRLFVYYCYLGETPRGLLQPPRQPPTTPHVPWNCADNSCPRRDLLEPRWGSINHVAGLFGLNDTWWCLDESLWFLYRLLRPQLMLPEVPWPSESFTSPANHSCGRRGLQKVSLLSLTASWYSNASADPYWCSLKRLPPSPILIEVDEASACSPHADASSQALHLHCHPLLTTSSSHVWPPNYATAFWITAQATAVFCNIRRYHRGNLKQVCLFSLNSEKFFDSDLAGLAVRWCWVGYPYQSLITKSVPLRIIGVFVFDYYWLFLLTGCNVGCYKYFVISCFSILAI